MIELSFPFPPSVNHTWMRGNGNRLYSNAKVKDFHEVAAAIIRSKRLGEPLVGRLKVEFTLHEKDKRKRDLDNFNKSAMDACTKNKVWHDDSQIDELIIRRGPVDRDNPRIVIQIQEINDGV